MLILKGTTTCFVWIRDVQYIAYDVVYVHTLKEEPLLSKKLNMSLLYRFIKQ